MQAPKLTPQQRRVLMAETQHGQRTIDKAYRQDAPVRGSTLAHVRLVAERLGFPLPPERAEEPRA